MSNFKNYDYLKKFINPVGRVVEVWHENVFHSIDEQVIFEAEEHLGYQFPEQLREFYFEIGYGNLTTPEKVPEDYTFYGVNEILRPSVAAAFYKPLEGDQRDPDEGPIDAGDGDHYMDASTYGLMEPGDLPFFEIGDSSSFLIMKPQGKYPNAVYYFDELIESEFKDFIWKLYHVSPSYYEDLF